MHALKAKLPFTPPPFRPLPLLGTGHRQTLAAVFWPKRRDIAPYCDHKVLLPDGDRLHLLAYQASAQAHKAMPIVLLVHGLTGSHRSNYMIRLTRRLLPTHRVFRLNLRGCGSGFGLAKHPYHSGRSEDLRTTLAYIHRLYPEAPIHLLSFSLGGNMALKMVGEQQTVSGLQSVMAISPPIDLLASVKRITLRQNRVFNRYFTKKLLASVQQLHQHFPELGPLDLGPIESVYEFDDAYTAPTCGFKHAVDYYQQCSARHYLHHIKTPTCILHAKDDPMVAMAGFQPESYQNAHLHWCLTPHGGHVGFLGRSPLTYGGHWMDSVIVAWLKRFQ